MSIERNERPRIDLLFFQKEMLRTNDTGRLWGCAQGGGTGRPRRRGELRAAAALVLEGEDVESG